MFNSLEGLKVSIISEFNLYYTEGSLKLLVNYSLSLLFNV